MAAPSSVVGKIAVVMFGLVKVTVVPFDVAPVIPANAPALLY